MQTAISPRAGRLRTALAGALLSALALTGSAAAAQAGSGYLPDETARHDATWLQWPHRYTYGSAYRDRLEPTWIAMTRALVQSEKVRIVVYDAAEQARVRGKLSAAGVSLARVEFLIRPTDDVWARDNGPIFVYGANDELKIADWGFNGWGEDAPYRKDAALRGAVAAELGIERVDLSDYIVEGGAVEVDGRGVLMATRSSILEPMRNPGVSQSELETALAAQLGVAKFIWLDGGPGGKDDITDMHIDGFARFGTPDTIVTMSRADLRYWGLSSTDVERLRAARDLDEQPYRFVELPLTARDVVTDYGYDIRFKGSYVNYYVANTVVLVPEYKDPNDAAAKAILQRLYPDRKVIGIDVRNLYRNGGMVHCVTQQQPAAL